MDIVKTLGMSKSTVWFKNTGELNYVNKFGRPRKVTVVDDQRMLSMVKKTKNYLLYAGEDVFT